MRILLDKLFPAIKDDNIRLQIFNHLYSIKNNIISIYIFIQDTKYVESYTRILKQLLPSKYKNSLSQHFQALYNRQTTIKIQTSEFKFQERKLPSNSYTF